MEVYIAPPEATPDAVLQRDQVLEALMKEGLVVSRTEGKPVPGSERSMWVLSIEGSEITLHFQEARDALVFATMDQSMFDTSDMPDRVCRALESLGWEVDQENIG